MLVYLSLYIGLVLNDHAHARLSESLVTFSAALNQVSMITRELSNDTANFGLKERLHLIWQSIAHGEAAKTAGFYLSKLTPHAPSGSLNVKIPISLIKRGGKLKAPRVLNPWRFQKNASSVDLIETYALSCTLRQDSVLTNIAFCLSAGDYHHPSIRYWHGIRFFVPKAKMHNNHFNYSRSGFLKYFKNLNVFKLNSNPLFYIISIEYPYNSCR